jgi:hypothetical protein
MARAAVVTAGHQEEIGWQAGVQLADVTEQAFLREHAFVVANSGMRASVIAGLWPRLREAFDDWQSTASLVNDPAAARERALLVLGNRAKIGAILACAEHVAVDGWTSIRRALVSMEDKPVAAVEYLGTFPYMGPTIRYHLAKNIGVQVAKPDRHLVRIAEHFGERDVQAFCRRIAEATGDTVPVVDYVLWRFAATVRPGDYLETMR